MNTKQLASGGHSGTDRMSFRQQLESDTVGSLTICKAIVVQPNALVRAAIAMMRDQSLGCAVIVERSLRPTGIFTEQSVIKVLNQKVCLDDSPVCNFADPNFFVVKASDPIMRVWEAVQSADARFVCVTDDNGKIFGITGQRGLSEYLTECYARQVTVQRLGRNRWMQQREGA